WGRDVAVTSRMRCIAAPWQQPCNPFSASCGATPCHLGSQCVASWPCNQFSAVALTEKSRKLWQLLALGGIERSVHLDRRGKRVLPTAVYQRPDGFSVS